MNTSALIDSPNFNTNLPPPLVPQQAVPTMSHPTEQQRETPAMKNSVSNAEILKSIQSIAKVMQQQLLFSS